MFTTGPGPEDSYHLWGDVEYDLAMEDLDDFARNPRHKRATWPETPTCPQTGLKSYDNHLDAKRAITRIKDWLADQDREYLPLMPVGCNHGNHWHTVRA